MERLSVFDIYKIGVGPSSSHTLGPWKAANRFAKKIASESVIALEIELFGSLSKTGIGHGTDVAVMMGLMGLDPEIVDTSTIPFHIQEIRSSKKLVLPHQIVPFDPSNHIIFQNFALPYHPNALQFKAYLQEGGFISEIYYSVGGGFILKEGDTDQQGNEIHLPFPIDQGKDLLQYTSLTGRAISDIVYKNELYFNDENYIKMRLMKIFNTMLECVYRGCHQEGILPGGLNVKRRAAQINARLLGGVRYENIPEWIAAIQRTSKDFSTINKWISCFALAVNEENASLSRVVTSPTNGAAGVIPAVLLYHYCFGDYQGEGDIIKFMLTSGEVGCIFKKGATISAAMGGCQAEIGVSSAMAAAGLTELQGGSPEQALMAAEIAMEHHLGLTCDPIGGLVQIPCIERNTMGAMKAITAANLALDSDPASAIVNLDVIVKTMWETAQDMHSKYRETSEGGLAVNIALPNC